MTCTVVCDLDGVVYLGNEAVPGAGEALVHMEAAGHRILFCTNNSSRTRQQSADKITRVTGYTADIDQIASSSMAAGRLLEGGRVLVVGGAGVVEAVELAGGEVVREGPADAVVVGIDFDFHYDTLDAASKAVREGARFIATNRDETFPTPDGLKPGAGALVAAIAAASGIEPEVAGKPEPTMRGLIGEMTGDGTVVMVGDRPGTDLAMAVAEGWMSILVESGVTPPGTQVEPTPDHVIPDITGLPGLLERLNVGEP